MKLLSPLILSAIIFCVGMFYFKLLAWFKLKKFTHLIKGVVDDIKIIDGKLFFIIKWTIPEKLRHLNPGNDLEDGVQYYHHYIMNTPKFENNQKEFEYLNQYVNKHNGRNFYLKAQLNNGTIRNITALENPGKWVFIYGFFTILLIYALLKLNNLI